MGKYEIGFEEEWGVCKETVLVVGLDELATNGYDVSDINQTKLREIADAMYEASDDWYWNALQEVAERKGIKRLK